MSDVFDTLIEKAKGTGKRIILTETEDLRIIEAAKSLVLDTVYVMSPKEDK